MEEAAVPEPGGKKRPAVPAADLMDLAGVEEAKLNRIKTNISEIDRVLGGGFLPGSVILLAGEPGIGKSTILAQIATMLRGHQPVYVSGEESASQVKDRFRRIGRDLSGLRIMSETDVDKIVSALEKARPAVVAIDSIQTVHTAWADSEPGSISQIRAATSRLIEYAKRHSAVVVIVGHITKDGQVAGPKQLEHMVDAVVYLENDRTRQYRLLRAVKNRFGSVNEIGIFSMTSGGLKEIKNPSDVFIDLPHGPMSGSVISSTMQGSRPFLVEVQALVSKTVFGYPQRKASGFDQGRLQVLSSVLTKRGGINLSNQDVIVNVIGGLKVNDPGVDLALCLSIASSLLNQTVSRRAIILGEVGLGGEVRPVARLADRVKEAAKLGFNRVIGPAGGKGAGKLEYWEMGNLSDIRKFLVD